MTTLEMSRAKEALAAYARRVATTGTIVLTSRGQPVAALVSIKNADKETVTLSTSAQFMALIERSRARQKEQGGLSGEEMQRRLAARRRPHRNRT
jgi:prevent-host-death family protein